MLTSYNSYFNNTRKWPVLFTLKDKDELADWCCFNYDEFTDVGNFVIEFDLNSDKDNECVLGNKKKVAWALSSDKWK